MNYAKINGKLFDTKVAISDYEEYFNVLDGDNAGRALSGKMIIWHGTLGILIAPYLIKGVIL